MGNKGWLGSSIIAALPGILLLVGQQIADFVARSQVSVNYSVNTLTLNGLTATYLKISNEQSHIGINKMEIAKISDNVRYIEFSRPSSNNNVMWAGSLEANSYLEVLLVSDKNINTDPSIMSKAISASYLAPDLSQKKIEVTEKGLISFNTVFLYYLILVSPSLIGLLLYGAYLKFVSNKNNRPA